jgi:hypothetical protein
LYISQLAELLEATSYFPFFLRSAQRFFIVSDKRLLRGERDDVTIDADANMPV